MAEKIKIALPPYRSPKKKDTLKSLSFSSAKALRQIELLKAAGWVDTETAFVGIFADSRK